jgi:heme exporter protein B
MKIMLYLVFKRLHNIMSNAPAQLCAPLVFGVMFLAILPLALGSDINILVSNEVSVAILFLCMSIIVMHMAQSLIKNDFDCGWLDYVLVHNKLLPYVFCYSLVLSGLLTMTVGLLLPIVMTLYAIQASMLALLGAISLAVISLTFIAVAFSLMLTPLMQASVVILLLLAFPSFLPIIVMGVRLCSAMLTGINVLPHYAVLLALMLIFIMIMPVASAFVYKHNS